MWRDAKARRQSRYFAGKAPPQRVPDHIVHGVDGACGLTVLFCGINPGAQSGALRRHYAHPTNVCRC